jgi:oxepin-CoA hydrolase/3-oxo-5,6-dehydrosuberyl-CoA semialdehyde dehydrogenase
MFIAADLETLLSYLNRLTPETQPKWGQMSAQRMVEHLTDTLQMATGKNPQKLEIPEDKIERMQAFLGTDKPMLQNMAVPFATPEMNDQLRHEELELAIDEFVEEWLYFEELFESEPGKTALHPFYGELTYEQWLRLSEKHHTHHFAQFGLID